MKAPNTINEMGSIDMVNELSPQWGKAAPQKLLKRWPKNEKGELSEPRFLCHIYSMDMNAELKVNMLEAYGIPCLVTYPGDGSFGKVLLGMSGNGVNIYVPEENYEDAKALCQEENNDEL